MAKRHQAAAQAAPVEEVTPEVTPVPEGHAPVDPAVEAPVVPAKESEAAVNADQAVDPEPEEEEVAVEEEQDPVEEVAVQQEATAPADDMVTLISADPKKQLEVSVGENTYKGTQIRVPRKLEGEIRRLLQDGGYYVKN